MQLMSPRATDALERLNALANGDAVLVNDAIERFNRGEISSLVAYIKERVSQGRMASADASPVADAALTQ